MRTETWEKLNGTCWGDDPRAISDCTYNGELEIPAFMFEPTQSVLVPAAAFRAQGVGRVKHARRMEQKQVRDVVNGVFWMLAGVGAFAAVCKVAMLLADALGRMVW